MGLFSSFKNHLISQRLDENGLLRGTNSECCERCQCHVQDPNSSYLICGLRRMHVGAGQVCPDFARGAPIYTIS